MGCLQSSEKKSQLDEESKDTKPKVYSWETRGDVDTSNFIIQNEVEQVVGRMPGQLSGQQCIIQNCEKSDIYIFDNSATVSVDDCINCRIFIGPSKGSVYIRDCSDCKFVVACQQFRTRDCKQLDVFLCCNTQPIIESSTGMKFGCFQYNYPNLQGQFDDAGLSVFNNNWSNIHDFTPANDVKTWTLLPKDANVNEYVPFPSPDKFPEIEVSADLDSSVVPVTLGSRRKTSDESCLVVFFPRNGATHNAKSFLREMRLNSFDLVRTKEIQMSSEDAQRVFGRERDLSHLQQGTAIGLEINGDNCVEVCNKVSMALFDGESTSEVAFVSSSKDTADKNIDDFYNFVDMTM